MHMKSTPETTMGKVLLIDIISLRETGQRQYKFQTRVYGWNVII